ncbi:Lipid phosphate phosphatase 2 [Zea mays]|uniref:Lipid phosphate phosphatase 2 n=1 Tax=Zea mays TaxID=4577 RepID=B4FZC5_MAIZE|nr:unknown [Zea mays]ONM21508.1 Lipid phosphate phosphatase 2 [Zea mays]ONM21509.1 Lipid phosphate phosphatase 2 [Zea mays]
MHCVPASPYCRTCGCFSSGRLLASLARCICRGSYRSYSCFVLLPTVFPISFRWRCFVASRIRGPVSRGGEQQKCELIQRETNRNRNSRYSWARWDHHPKRYSKRCGVWQCQEIVRWVCRCGD